MKAKLKFIIPVVVLVLAGAGYKTVLAKPPVKVKHKIEGTVVVLPKDFLINLKAGGVAKLTVGLIFKHMPVDPAAAEGHAAKPPEGYSGLYQEAVARAVVTEELTAARRAQLLEQEGREKLKKRVLKALDKQTDLHAEEVVFSDLIVQ